MTLKKYKYIKIVFVVVLAIVFSQSIYYKNYLIPIALMIAIALILMLLRRRVEGVIADERDYTIAGKAALFSIQIYGWIAVISMLIFYGLRDLNPVYEPIAMTLSFSTCFLMLLYSVVFRYLSKLKFSDKKLLYRILILVLFFAIFVIAARLFSGEDNWICVNGEWQKHGNPSFQAPKAECQ